jgi:LPXTG-motif cell wall-anchored protein
MRLFNRKSQLQRLLETVNDTLDPSSWKNVELPSTGKALKTGLIAAGGVAGLTAASASISSIRRRAEGARRNS